MGPKLNQEIKNIERLNGIRVYETSWMMDGSGICLPGIGIFIHTDIPIKSKAAIIQHEFGHYLDYKFGLNGDRKKFLGSYLLGFYILIGIPSLLNLIPLINHLPTFRGSHQTFWTEIRANQLSKAHFGELLAEGFDRRFPSKYEV